MASGSPDADRFGLCGRTLAERYAVERRIAEGGFAVVYRATQLALERPVALKVLKTPDGLDDAARARFHDRFAAEAKTIARLKHPYIVAVHDFGVAEMPSGEEAPWMALEWLDGETLESDLERRRGRGGRAPAEALALLRPVVEALAYAHRYGVVHRDIKPANLMTVTSERGPLLRMLDFGIAKLIPAGGDPEGTGAGHTSGAPGFSPHYAAPEQVTFSRTGPFTDVHALGLVLTEVLTDQPPYTEGPDDGDQHLFEQVMSTARPTPRRRGKSVGRLEKIVEKAVALSPRRRWPDAGALLAALDEAAASGELGRNTRTDPAAEPDLDAEPAPRPITFAERRTILTVGALAIVVAFGTLLKVLGSGAQPTSAAAELAAAARPHPSRAPALAGPPAPWIVPLAAPPAAPGPAELAAPAPRRARLPADEGDGALPARAACKVTVNSVPWSEVWIDGKSTGAHTPVVDQEIACGRHRLEFKRSDLKIDQVEAVLVAPGETFKRRYTLADLPE
ncbi:MAG TPA: serine/threonine-protein kinase [Polyangia bacterium]|nr:serine/threonine-protein kinase [Polyangia bacterium]